MMFSPNSISQPPPRYTDASLVKKMEELGIGRPSTYASIMQVIEKRGYVVKDNKRFIPRTSRPDCFHFSGKFL